jgi:hypothetical protein
MPVVESTPGKLVLTSGSTSITLDKDAGKATLQRKLLFWKLKPIETPLTDIAAVNIDKAVDRASSVEVYHTMLVTCAGAGWALAAKDQTEAESDASALRAFLGLTS